MTLDNDYQETRAFMQAQIEAQLEMIWPNVAEIVTGGSTDAECFLNMQNYIREIMIKAPEDKALDLALVADYVGKSQRMWKWANQFELDLTEQQIGAIQWLCHETNNQLVAHCHALRFQLQSIGIDDDFVPDWHTVAVGVAEELSAEFALHMSAEQERVGFDLALPAPTHYYVEFGQKVAGALSNAILD